jgi:putative Holliday junction resolvase
MTRLLAIDHGARRLGIAVGDTETRLAFPRPAVQRRGTARDLQRLTSLARDEGAGRVVVGLPRNMDGSEGPQAAAARDFGEQLAAAIGLPVVYSDERLSSWEAGERLQAAGRRVTRRSGELDSAAAVVILQQYLDTLEEAE